MCAARVKRIAVRTDPTTGGTWPVRVPAPDWVANGVEDYQAAPKPSKGQRARARRYRRTSNQAADPTPPMELHDPIRWELKQEVLQAAGYRCVKCKSRNRLTLDHIVPRVIGGGHHLANLQCLCKKCNKAKGATIWAPSFPHQNAA